MAKIPKPRKDYGRIKDGLASHFFHFVFNFYVAVFLYVMFYFGLTKLFLTSTQMAHVHYMDFDFLYIALGLEVVFYGFAIWLRATKYRTIPVGWSREQFLAKMKLDGKSKAIPDRFSRIYWIGFIALCAVIEVVWLSPSGNYFAVFPLLMVALFVWICVVVTHSRVSMSPSERTRTLNMEKLWQAGEKAKGREMRRGIGNKILGVICFVLCCLEIAIYGFEPLVALTVVGITILIFVSVIVVRKIRARRPKMR